MSSNSTSGFISKGITTKDSKRYCTYTLIGALFTIARKVETIQVSMYGWMDEQNVIYT